jgi:hypothetical protein
MRVREIFEDVHLILGNLPFIVLDLVVFTEVQSVTRLQLIGNIVSNVLGLKSAIEHIVTLARGCHCLGRNWIAIVVSWVMHLGSLGLLGYSIYIVYEKGMVYKER